ncbi:Metallo-dependent phosphatase-like protein [Scenedesmus sp. NREL 46B-D3]|nr:Metallo-dependent phosphatase-like protein [Scenedesmus sp. NREL 46B-D3]
MATSSWAAQPSGETAKTHHHELGDDLPLFKFGLLTDVQYADKETVSFDGRPQRYSESAGKLQAALKHLSDLTQLQQDPVQPLSCLLTLGDIIDGYGGDDSCSAAARAGKDLRLIVGLISSGLQDVPARHALGNHCLAAPRTELLEVLNMPCSYYCVPLAARWKLIVLDTTEMSLHSGYPEGSAQMQQALRWLQAHPKEQHPNAEGWNGGLSATQMTWLQLELAEAAMAGQRVIVACHHPLAPGSAPDQYLAWGYEAVLQLLEQHAGTVCMVFSGHYHPGGYAQHGGIHFVVFEGILEAPPDSNAYAVVEIWPSKAVIHGYGVGSSRQLPFM